MTGGIDPRPQTGSDVASSDSVATGVRLQEIVNSVRLNSAQSPAKSVLLGIMLAVMIVAGGLIAFLVVWAILVGFFA